MKDSFRYDILMWKFSELKETRMPRVITGRYRGAVLAAPKGDSTRPTTDKVKEAIFSSIQGRIDGCCFLDLFSGTGQMGIEARSRGASKVVLVDKGMPAIAVIRKNLEKLRIGKDDPDLRVLKMSATAALESLKDERFDIVYLDPPYKIAHEEAVKVADILNRYDMLNDGGLMIVEHSSEEPFNTDVINMKLSRSCSYGLCVVTFFSKN